MVVAGSKNGDSCTALSDASEVRRRSEDPVAKRYKDCETLWRSTDDTWNLSLEIWPAPFGNILPLRRYALARNSFYLREPLLVQLSKLADSALLAFSERVPVWNGIVELA